MHFLMIRDLKTKVWHQNDFQAFKWRIFSQTSTEGSGKNKKSGVFLLSLQLEDMFWHYTRFFHFCEINKKKSNFFRLVITLLNIYIKNIKNSKNQFFQTISKKVVFFIFLYSGNGLTIRCQKVERGLPHMNSKLLVNLTFWKTEYLIAQLRTGIWQKNIRLKTCPQGVLEAQ